MTVTRSAAALLAVLLIVCFAGCGETPEKATDAAEEAVKAATEAAETAGGEVVQKAADLAAQIADMTPEEIQAKADELKTTLTNKETELTELTKKLEGMSPADLAGDMGKQLQSKSDMLTKEIASLKEKLKAFTAALTE